MNNLAADLKFYDGSGFTGFGSLGLETKGAADAPNIFASVISVTIGIMTLVAILWFVFVFLSGAIAIIASGGDKAAFEGAKKKITTGFIGLVITVFAILIVNLFGNIMGLGNVLDFTALFTKLLII